MLPPSSSTGTIPNLRSSPRIHMNDRSWAPYGLVKYGVAPDHLEVKVCISNVFRPSSIVDVNLISSVSKNCAHKFDNAALGLSLFFLLLKSKHSQFNSISNIVSQSTDTPAAAGVTRYRISKSSSLGLHISSRRR